MSYSMEAAIEASRLEEQVYQSNYSLSKELEYFKLEPEDWVMDAGCGTGVLSRFLVENYDVKHVDALEGSELRVQQAKVLCLGPAQSKIHFYHQDLNEISAQFKGKYDVIICRYVLEHVQNPIKVLSELKGCLKKGGRLNLIDLDGVFFNLYSENETLNHYMQEIKEMAHFDLEIGRKLPNLLKKVGLSQIEWHVELLSCRGASLEEERLNTEKRFVALASFLTEILGSSNKYHEFMDLYLKEMMLPENTLVFTKYLCTGTCA